MDDVHIIGHSMGAHIASYAANSLPNLPRITGLDPAGPMFANMPPAVRLDEKDAKFVDVVHTNEGVAGLNKNLMFSSSSK